MRAICIHLCRTLHRHSCILYQFRVVWLCEYYIMYELSSTRHRIWSVWKDTCDMACAQFSQRRDTQRISSVHIPSPIFLYRYTTLLFTIITVVWWFLHLINQIEYGTQFQLFFFYLRFSCKFTFRVSSLQTKKIKCSGEGCNVLHFSWIYFLSLWRILFYLQRFIGIWYCLFHFE